MTTPNFLDQAGLSYLWTKIVAAIESHSVTLPDKLVSYKAVTAITATEKLNADTLGGYSASYFAKGSDVSDLSDSVTEQAQLLATLGPKVTTLGTTVDSYETRVSDLESNEELQDTAIAQHSTAIAQHSTAIAQMSAKVDDHTLSIKTLGDTVNGYSSSISELNTSVEEVEQSLLDKLDKSGGTMTGPLVAKADSAELIAQIRNIIFSASDPTASDGSDGDVWIKYET